jgi:hypothetical protein
MGRDKDSQRPKWRMRGESVYCEKCGGFLYEGDWPYCKGQPSDHRRD